MYRAQASQHPAGSNSLSKSIDNFSLRTMGAAGPKPSASGNSITSKPGNRTGAKGLVSDLFAPVLNANN